MYSAESLLQAAEAEVKRCRTAAARATSTKALAAARQEGDGHRQARALLLLSHTEVLSSRLRSAYHLTQNALHLFDLFGDGVAGADALMLLSYCAASLGIEGVGLVAAQRCCELLDLPSTPPTQRAAALNYLGVAAFWAGEAKSARSALEGARWHASEAGDVCAAFQPLVNGAFLEVLRLEEQRSRSADDAAELHGMVLEMRCCVHSRRHRTLTVVPPLIGLLLSDFIAGYVNVMIGEPDGTARALSTFSLRARSMPSNSWLRCLPLWILSERARMQGDPALAIHYAHQMQHAAGRGEHGPLTRIADLRVRHLRGLELPRH